MGVDMALGNTCIPIPQDPKTPKAKLCGAVSDTTTHYTGYDRVLNNLLKITRTLKSTPGARENLILHYIQHKWLGTTESPVEGELVRLTLLRIEQDPSQFDLFIDILRDTEGMDLIVTTLTAGELILDIVQKREHLNTRPLVLY